MYFIELLCQEKNNDNCALIEDMGRSLSYREWYRQANYWAKLLAEKGDNIMVAIGNKIEFAIAVMAIWICGKTAVLLDRNLTKRELDSIANQSNSRTLLTDETNREWEHDYDVIILKGANIGIKEEIMNYIDGSSTVV